MSSTQYFNIIRDPTGNIFVEDVRLALKTTSIRARTYCEMAVIDNLFIRRIGLLCPNNENIIQSFSSEKEIPKTITCIECEINGEHEFEFNTIELRRIVYYKLNL